MTKKRIIPPTKDHFAKLVMDGIRKAGATTEIVYDPEEFRISPGVKDGTVLFLGNTYDEYCSAPESMRPKVLQKLVRVWFSAAVKPPEAFDDVHPDLLPVVRARSYFDLARVNGGKGPVLPHQVLGEHLGIGLVYDLPQMMRTISEEELNGWGVTFYEALEAARENLTQLEHPFVGPKEGEGIYLSAANDNYDSSRLLLLDLIRQFQVAGDPIAMVPNCETLIVTGSEDLDGLKGMLKLATNALQQPRPISGIALRLDDDWVPWLPEPLHPLFNEFRALHLLTIAKAYAGQKEMLDATEENTFVATYCVTQHRETGRYMTYCVWPGDMLALLPRTDTIAFMRTPDKPPLIASWDRVVEVVGDLMEPLDIYPERFRVSDFPTETQLAAMGAGSL